MVTLKDQLVKLGVVSEDEAQSRAPDQDQFAETPHPNERRQNKRKSGNGPNEPSSRERGGRNVNRGTQKKNRQNPASHLTPEERAKEADALIERARVSMPHRGHKRYYYQLPSGDLDYLEVDHSGYQALTGGAVCVVFNRKGQVCMIDGRAFNDLWHLAPDLIPKVL